jgi:hypothetical protein
LERVPLLPKAGEKQADPANCVRLCDLLLLLRILDRMKQHRL